MSMSADIRKASSPPQRPLFSWWVNLLVFSLLAASVLALFFFQQRRVSADFQEHSLDQARLVAGVMQENVNNSLLAADSINSVIASFLQSSGKFVAYLDEVEPFRSEELESFAQEAGLAGITIMKPGRLVSAPPNWYPGTIDCRAEGLVHSEATRSLTSTVVPLAAEEDEACLVVGIDSSGITELRRRAALESQLDELSRLPGIAFVRMEQPVQEKEDGAGMVRLLLQDGQPIAVARLPAGDGILAVGLDARQYAARISQLREQFFSMAALLAGLGFSSSWLLYRYQQNDLRRTRDWDKLLARQHEDAALGRAAAAIAHEIRNPLNAIHMGLQRLRLESTNLEPEQDALLAAMEEASRRTDSIISDLKRFARPLVLERQELSPISLLEQTVTLYLPACRKQGIAVVMENTTTPCLFGDRQLLGELFDNLLRNAVEAQPDGGFIRVSSRMVKDGLRIAIANGNCRLSEEEIQQMGEPYFTTKTRGSGLGLPLARRIIEAHGGSISLERETEGHTLHVRLFFPGVAVRAA